MEPSIDSFKNKRILITGGGGYLGSRLAEKLVDSGPTIFLLDKNFNSIAENLIENHYEVRKLEADILNRQQLIELCSEIAPDYIFHFAAALNRIRDFSIFGFLLDVNVNGTLNLLEAIKEIPYKGFYFASSGEVYGSKNEPPFTEDQIPAPVSPYSLTKLFAEHVIKTFSDINKKPYTILRIFNFYGPGMPKDFFINQLVETLNSGKQFNMTGGEQIRDFLYLDDLLNAIIFICIRSKNEVINVCSGKGIKLKELALGVAGVMDKINFLNIGALEYRENEVWNMLGSNQRLLNLGFTLKNQNILLNIKECIL